MIMLAIGMGLFLSLEFLLTEIHLLAKRERKAATTIVNGLRRHMFRRRWRRRQDPTSVMGRTTAWDNIATWHTWDNYDYDY
jgi:hypothetical protein